MLVVLGMVVRMRMIMVMVKAMNMALFLRTMRIITATYSNHYFNVIVIYIVDDKRDAGNPIY